MIGAYIKFLSYLRVEPLSISSGLIYLAFTETFVMRKLSTSYIPRIMTQLYKFKCVDISMVYLTRFHVNPLHNCFRLVSERELKINHFELESKFQSNSGNVLVFFNLEEDSFGKMMFFFIILKV